MASLRRRNYATTALWCGLAVSLLFGPLAPTTQADGRQGIIFYSGLEKGDLSGFYWYQNEPEVVRASHPVRAGTFSMRTVLDYATSRYKHKTMVHVNRDANLAPNTQSILQLENGKDYWIGFSIYVPSDWKPSSEGELLWQFQASPDPGEIARSPILTAYLRENQHTFAVMARGDSRATGGTSNNFTNSYSWDVDMRDQIGRWNDWVINTRFSHRGDGFVKIWINGQLVVNAANLVNGCNDQKGPYPSFGVYKWEWDTRNTPSGWKPGTISRREYYFDEIRIADASASYQDVAPGDAPGTPPPAPAPTALPPSPPSGGGDEIIVDDRDPGFSVRHTDVAWERFVGESPQQYGDSHHYNPSIGSGQDVATWAFSVPKPGRYEVFAWWAASDSRPPDVPYYVDHMDGQTRVLMNQQQNGGRWNLLTTANLEQSGQVTVTDGATSGRNIVADAIRLVYIGPLIGAGAVDPGPGGPNPGDPNATAQVWLPILAR